MADIEFNSAVPVLPSLDIEASVSFYKESLGFSLAFQYPDYAGVQRGPVQVHFWRCEDPAIPKMTSCRINLRGVDALYKVAQVQGVVHPNGPLATSPGAFGNSPLWISTETRLYLQNRATLPPNKALEQTS